MGLAGSQSGAGRGPPLRIFVYNPCSLTATERLEDVATTRRAEILLCPETRIRATIGEPPTGCNRSARSGWRDTAGGHAVLTPVEVLAARWSWVDDWWQKKKGALVREIRAQNMTKRLRRAIFCCDLTPKFGTSRSACLC